MPRKSNPKGVKAIEEINSYIPALRKKHPKMSQKQLVSLAAKKYRKKHGKKAKKNKE